MDINKIKTVFRKSKEWDKKREQLIKERGEKCEWCGSIEYLTPAHKDCDEWIKCTSPKNEQLLVCFSVRNSCLKSNYYLVFHYYFQQMLEKTPPKDAFNSKGKLQKEHWKLLYEQNKTNSFLMKIVEMMEERFIEWYKNFDNCLLLCRRCHRAQGKGMVLCSCKKNYYDPQRYKTCYNCNPEKELIEVRAKIREIQEEVEELEYDEICDNEQPSCELCGKSYDWKGDWEFYNVGYLSVSLCPECREISNKKEIVNKKAKKQNKDRKIRNKKIEKKIEILEKQQRALLKKFPSGDFSPTE